MATPHFRHQLHLHGAQVAGRRFTTWLRSGLILALVLALPWAAQAQRKRSAGIQRDRKGRVTGITVDNLPAYNERFFRPGFYISVDYSRFFLEQSALYVQNRNLAANSIISPGFGVGFIGDIRLGDPSTPFHLRFAPGVTFLTRRVEFVPQPGYPKPDSIFTQEVGTTQIELPFLLKYQSNRRRNTRLYMIAGIKPSTTIGSRRSDPLRNTLRATDSDLTLEYGVGLDLFYPLFKFAPEIRFSHGLRNVLVGHNDAYSNSLQSLRTNTVTLYLNFE